MPAYRGMAHIFRNKPMSTLIFIICGIFFALGTITVSYYLYRIRSRNAGKTLNDILLTTYRDNTAPLANRAQAGLDLAELFLNEAHPESATSAQHILEELLGFPELDQTLGAQIKCLLAGVLLEQCDAQSYTRANELLQNAPQLITHEQRVVFTVVKSSCEAKETLTPQQRKQLLETLDRLLSSPTLPPYARAWAINTRTQLLALSDS